MVNELPFNPFKELSRDLGEPFGEPDHFSWLRGGQLLIPELETKASPTDRELARAQIIQTDTIATNAYLPLESEPELYLEYAAVGIRSWRNRVDRAADSTVDEIQWALDLTERFGILKNGPVNSQSFKNSLIFGTTEPTVPSVWDVMSEARSIALVLEGHQFSTQASAEAGKGYSTHRSAAFNLEMDIYESALSETSSKPVDAIQESRERARGYEWGDRSVEEYRIFVASDISSIVNQVLSEERVQTVVASSINFGEFKSGSVLIEPSWLRKFQVNTLRGAIWVQVANHIMSGSTWRKCHNATCDRGLFRVERPKSRQRYCDQYCKDQQNNRDKYKKHPERYARKKS
jgi:hypothetical protein